MSLDYIKKDKVKINVKPVTVHSLRAVLVRESVDKDLPCPDLSDYEVWDHKFFDLCRKAQVDTFFKLGISMVDKGTKDYLHKLTEPSYIIQSKYGSSLVYINRVVLEKNMKNFGERVLELRKRYNLK